MTVAGSGGATANRKLRDCVEAAARREREHGVRRFGAVDLGPKLPRRPEVVVVEEADPAPPRRGDSGVAGDRDAMRGLVADDPHARVVELGQPRRASRRCDPSSTTITSASTSSARARTGAQRPRADASGSASG